MIVKVLNLLVFVVFLFTSQDLMAPPLTSGFFDRLGANLRGFGNEVVGFFNSPPPPPMSGPGSQVQFRRPSISNQTTLTTSRPQPSASISRAAELCQCPTSSSFIKNGAFENGCFRCRKPYFARNYVLAFLDSVPLSGPIIYSDRDLEWQWKCPECKNYNCVVRQECEFTSFFGLKCQGKRSNILAPLTEWKGKAFNLPQIIDRQGRGHELRVDARAGSFFLIDKKFIQIGWLNPATDQDLYEFEDMGGFTAFSVDDNGNKIPKIRAPDKVTVYEHLGNSWRPIATLISGEVRQLSDLVSPGIKRKHCSCFGIFRDKDHPGRYVWRLKGYNMHGIAPKSSPFFLDACGLDCLKLIACPKEHFGRLRTDPNLCRVCKHNFDDVIVPKSLAIPIGTSLPISVIREVKSRPQFVGRPDAAIESALKQDEIRQQKEDLIRQRKTAAGIAAPTTLARPIFAPLRPSSDVLNRPGLPLVPSQYFGKCKDCGKQAPLQRGLDLCKACADIKLQTYEQKLRDRKKKLQDGAQARRVKIGQVDDLVRSQDSVRRDFYGQEGASFQAIQDEAARERKEIGDRVERESFFANQARVRGSIDGERNAELKKMSQAFSAGRDLISAQDEARKALEKTEADARRKLELEKRKSLRQQRERTEGELMEVQDLRVREIEKEKMEAVQRMARFAAPQKDFKCVTCHELRSPENFAGISATGGNICQDCMLKAANLAISQIKIPRGQSSSQKRQGSRGSQNPVSSGGVGILKTLKSEVFNPAVWNPFSD